MDCSSFVVVEKTNFGIDDDAGAHSDDISGEMFSEADESTEN